MPASIFDRSRHVVEHATAAGRRTSADHRQALALGGAQSSPMAITSVMPSTPFSGVCGSRGSYWPGSATSGRWRRWRRPRALTSSAMAPAQVVVVDLQPRDQVVEEAARSGLRKTSSSAACSAGLKPGRRRLVLARSVGQALSISPGHAALEPGRWPAGSPGRPSRRPEAGRRPIAQSGSPACGPRATPPTGQGFPDPPVRLIGRIRTR